MTTPTLDQPTTENTTSPLIPETQAKKRFAYVGTGSRVKMFLDPVARTYGEDAEIVGLCDTSLKRAEYHRERIASYGYPKVPVFSAREFSRMIEETRPDTVVVCTRDRDHDEYIVASLRAGCDVVTEKPMTIDEERCRRILEAVEETGHSVRVTFNYRWAPGATKVKELLASGLIGQVRQVNMEYLLNTSHGADYFRRWHSQKENSGGLLVHKSTHHFDLVNWWIDAIPDQVFARGGLYFYGRENALARGDEALTSYPRYHGADTKGDPFAFHYADSVLEDTDYEKNVYLGAEEESQYIRDQNVFRDGIDIEDVMNVIVRYRDGALLNYSLNAFSPYEGYRVTFTGDRGRIEYEENHGPHLADADGRKLPNDEHSHSGGHRLWVYPHFKKGYEVEIPSVDEGGHGGADPLIQEQIFKRNPSVDHLGRSAGHEQGAASILIGIGANRSIRSGENVQLRNLASLRPDAKKLSELI